MLFRIGVSDQFVVGVIFATKSTGYGTIRSDISYLAELLPSGLIVCNPSAVSSFVAAFTFLNEFVSIIIFSTI